MKLVFMVIAAVNVGLYLYKGKVDNLVAMYGCLILAELM